MTTRYLISSILLMALTVFATPDTANAYGLMLRPINIDLPEEQGPQYPLLSEGDLRYLNPVAAAQWLKAQEMDRDLDTIYWTVKRDASLYRVAVRWGMRQKELIRKNPQLAELGPDDLITRGTRLLVYRWDPLKPTQAVGRTNRGKLLNGMPMPEGPYWKLRTMRYRHYGSRLAVQTLVDAMMAYGERFPGAPAIHVGELSRERGGKLRPHKSHRNGRDADIGYIPLYQYGGRWFTATGRNMDAAKTWFFIETLIDSGNVHIIGVDKRLQRVLNKVAVESGRYTDEELARIFEYPHRPGSNHAILQHWPGHQDHMHIRFRCESWNARCDEH